MQKDEITQRISDRDARVINYRPLGPGQDFKRTLSPAPQRATQQQADIALVQAPIQSVAPIPTVPFAVAPLPSSKPISFDMTVSMPMPKPVQSVPKPIEQLPPEPPLEAIPEEKKKKRRFSFGRTVAIAAVVGVLGLTGYVSYDTWHTNKEVKEVVAKETPADTSVLGEGTDETEVSANTVDNYKVSADLPRVLNIESLGIRSRILPMSVTNKGAIQAPSNIFDSGWYTGSAKPGTPGAGLIDAHASGATHEGLFAYLDKLKEGDKITIEKGSGEILTYSVVHTEIVDLSAVDMSKMLETYGDVKEGINLITCSGTWMPDDATYDKRVLVYTERI